MGVAFMRVFLVGESDGMGEYIGTCEIMWGDDGGGGFRGDDGGGDRGGGEGVGEVMNGGGKHRWCEGDHIMCEVSCGGVHVGGDRDVMGVGLPCGDGVPWFGDSGGVFNRDEGCYWGGGESNC